jgi:hypothetical protein
VPPKPPIGVSSVIDLNRSPNNFIAVVSLRRNSHCYPITPQRARVCGVFIVFAPARNQAFSA